MGRVSSQGLGSTDYIWLLVEGGNAIPVGIYRNGRFYQVHSDHLGTPRLVTDSVNAPVWQWPYSAFGNNRSTGMLARTTTSSGAVTLKATKPPLVMNLRFPGQYFDEETNLAYNGFRFYRPFGGDYAQMDPIGLPGGLNRRAYVEANPLSFTDPTGQAAVGIGGVFLGLGALAVIEMSRPKNMSPAQESLFDRYCKDSDDSCAALKARLRRELDDARAKMRSMQTDDRGLFMNAYETPNKVLTGTSTTWLNHRADLAGRLGKIRELIALAHKIGCDVSKEAIEAESLFVPRRPGGG